MKNIVYLQTLKVILQFKLMKYCMPNILFGCIDLSIEIHFNYFPQAHTWTYKIKATVMLSLCFYGLNYVSNLFVFMLSFIYIYIVKIISDEVRFRQSDWRCPGVSNSLLEGLSEWGTRSLENGHRCGACHNISDAQVRTKEYDKEY